MSTRSHGYSQSPDKGAFSVGMEGQTLFRLRRQTKPVDWRRLETTGSPWNLRLLATAIISMCLAASARAAAALVSSPLASVFSTVLWWALLVLPVIIALWRFRPAGLLRVRASDLLWGVGLGLALQGIQGIVGGSRSELFPSLAIFETTPSSTWISFVLPTLTLAPLVEEFLLRAVVLVIVFQLLWPRIGSLAAGFSTMLLSAGGFVLLHAVFSPLNLVDALMLFSLGILCGATVLLTGRICGAVLTHLVYNLSYVALALAGTTMA